MRDRFFYGDTSSKIDFPIAVPEGEEGNAGINTR